MSKDITPRSRCDLPAGDLSGTAKAYIAQAIRPNTLRAYKTQVARWIDWADRKGVVPFPASVETVANYLAYLAENGGRDGTGASLSTIRTVLAAIKYGHDLRQGLEFNTRAPAIVKTLRGIANAQTRIQDQAEPLRGADVLEMILDASKPAAGNAGRRDAALLALGYMFALRRSELVGVDFDQLGDGIGCVRITAKALEPTLARSKTSKGETEVVTVPRVENAEAVKAIEAWIAAAGIKPGEPLARQVNKSDRVGGRLSAQSVSLIIKRRVAEHYRRRGVPADLAQETAKKMSAHSLRVGFATTAAESGADIRAIASVTRHKSLDMPRRYAQRADQIRTSPHRMPGVGLSQVSLRPRQGAEEARR